MAGNEKGDIRQTKIHTMKTYIWTLPTRIFHWLLAVSFAIAFISGGEEEYINLHAGLGILIGTLVIFRLIQGFWGPRYARFKDFPISPSSIMKFITNMKQSKSENPGHNPLASVVMLSIFIMGLVSALSGFLLVASGENGFLGIRTGSFLSQDVMGEIHDVVVHLFLILVGIHLTGIAVDLLFHREQGTLWSIFTGYKNTAAPPATITGLQKSFSIVWFVLSLLICFYVIASQPVTAGEGEETEQMEEDGKGE
jgi:cytochrome b